MLRLKMFILVFICSVLIFPAAAHAKSSQEDVVFVLQNGANALGAVGLCDMERAKTVDIGLLEKWFAENFDDHKYIWLTFISGFQSENKNVRRILAYNLNLQLSGNNSCPIMFNQVECPAMIEKFDRIISIIKE